MENITNTNGNNNNNDKDFLLIMEGLVSNDVKIREKNLEKVKGILLSDDVTNEDKKLEILYGKIWRIYWNADKSVYQKKMADSLANIFFSQDMNFNSEHYELWIRTFMIEFLKKWPKIDFHRIDKYIMLSQTILKRYFEINLQNENFNLLLNFFDLVSFCMTSGYYNFGFISMILKLMSFFVDDIFKNEGEVEIKRKFLEGYFLDFFEKLLKIFINVKDNRENNSFKEFIFSKIYDKFSDEEGESDNKTNSNNSFIKISELKVHFVKRLFDFAKSKENIPDNKRKIIYKIYKQMKYNQKEEENVNGNYKAVDPVNDYILNKNYTQRVKLSKLERMKKMIERTRNEKRIKKIIQEEELKKKQLEIKINKDKEEILEENVVRLDDETEDKDKDGNSNEAEELEEDEEEEIEFEEEEEVEEGYEDENGYWNSLLNNSGSDEAEDDDLIYSEDDLNDEDDFEENEDDDEAELDPRFLYFLVDSGNEALQEISEEDKKIIEAYKNCQKNAQILKKGKKKLNKKGNVVNKNNSSVNNKDNCSNTKTSTDANSNSNVTADKKNDNKTVNNSSPNVKAPNVSDNLSGNKNNKSNSNNSIGNNVANKSEKKQVEENSKSNTGNNISKRKNSVNSQTSNGVPSKKKRRNVQFKFTSNQFNEYDQSKPITLTSKRSMKNENKSADLKGSLKISKNKKN